MDKYIKMLMVKLSQQYKATLTSVMYFVEDTGRLGTTHTLRISRKGEKAALHEYQTHSKRDLVQEMMKWASPQSQ